MLKMTLQLMKTSTDALNIKETDMNIKMATTRFVIALLSVFTLAACDSEKSDKKGAVDPNSIEAKSLQANPWCEVQRDNNGGRYELRYVFQDKGILKLEVYEIDAKGDRLNQVDQKVSYTWSLNGDILQIDGSDGFKDKYTVTFDDDRNLAVLKLTYQKGGFDQIDDYYGCK